MKKITAKLFASILAVAMVFTMTPLGTGQVYAEGNTVMLDGVKYLLGDAETATVSGYDDSTIEPDVSIHETITVDGVDYSTKSIKQDALSNCSRLESITIPSSVTDIGANAFWGSGLKTVTFAEDSGITSIGPNTFSNCAYLETITIPSSVTSIGENAFSNCAYLENITIPSSVTSIGMNAFIRCTSLESIRIPSSVTSIGEGAFVFSGLNTVTFEEDSTITSIPKDAFGSCTSLKSITIPASVTNIGDGAFWGSGRNTETFTVTFEEGSKLTSIPKDMVTRCTSLKSITIPPGVTSIGENAFGGCLKLNSVTIPSNVTSIGENAFSGCTELKDIEIPDSVKSIGGYAFSGTGLTNIIIPKGVTTISEGTFSDCSSLESVTIPSGVTSIGENAFGGCAKLKAIEIPDSVKSIGGYAFSGTGLTNIIIPKGVTTISGGTFSNCSSLELITIPSTVTKIEAGSFEDTPLLTTIHFLGKKAQWNAITGNGKPTNVTVTTVEDPISIAGAKVVLSAKTFTYNGIVQKPSVKTIGGKRLKAGTDYTITWSNKSSRNVGPYTATIKGKGNYTGVAKAVYKINPKGTSLKKLVKAKKAVTVRWKKQPMKMSMSRITGYRIQFATNSKFTKNKKTVTVKGYKKVSQKVRKLKGGKKYYVRICTYKTIKGKKFCSAWSKFKTVTTKK